MSTTRISKTTLLADVITALQERDRDLELDSVDTVSMLEDAVADTYRYLTGTVWKKGAKHRQKGSIKLKHQSNTRQRRTRSHPTLRELAELIVKRWSPCFANPNNSISGYDAIDSLENYVKLAKCALKLETRI